MNKIPTHKISETFSGNSAFIVHVSDKEAYSNVDHRAGHAHRDDYYIFFLVKNGTGKITIDFVDYELVADTIHCIMPG